MTNFFFHSKTYIRTIFLILASGILNQMGYMLENLCAMTPSSLWDLVLEKHDG